MSLRRLPYLAVIAAIVIAITGCPPDDTAPPPDDDVRVEAAHVQEFQSQMNARLNDVRSDADMLDNRVDQVDEDDRDALRDDIQDMRSDIQDVEQRIQNPDTSDASAFRSHRQGVHTDVNDLEKRADRKLIEHAPDRNTLRSDAETRMQRIDQQMQEVPQADRPENYQERRDEVQQKLAEIDTVEDDELDNLRSDIAGGLEDLRDHIRDAHDAMDWGAPGVRTNDTQRTNNGQY
jgi:hypothetical protein